MKNLKVPYLLLFALFLSSISYCQQRAVTSIQQNVNEAAHGLEQKLNHTLDTLTLKSTTDILRVTFLDHNAKDSHIIDVGSKEIKIPLYHFKKGRYTIAVYTHDKIIALGANRLNDIPVPEDAVADLEESILRSSLTDEQLVSRNIKPRKKKVNTTYDNDTRVTTAKPKKEIKKTPKRSAKAKTKDTRIVEVKSKHEAKEQNIVTDKVKDTRTAETKPKRDTKEKAKTIAKTKPKAKVKDTRVAEAKPKPKRKTKKRTQSNGKSALAIALEKKERKRLEMEAAAARKDKIKIEYTQDNTVASNDNESDAESIGTLITVKKVTYNLSNIDNESIDKQSRAEYRANNLRPNGTAYED